MRETSSDATMGPTGMNVERVSIGDMASFLERFSRGHCGWLTRIEVEDETRRGEIDTDVRPLGGIVADPEGNGLRVILKNGSRRPSSYSIDQATEIWRETSEGAVRLEVTSADGSTTVVECHPAGH